MKDFLEIKCTECDSYSIPDRSKWGCEPDLCDKCLSIGWSPIILDDMLKDKELFGKVEILSPIQDINI